MLFLMCENENVLTGGQLSYYCPCMYANLHFCISNNYMTFSRTLFKDVLLNGNEYTCKMLKIVLVVGNVRVCSSLSSVLPILTKQHYFELHTFWHISKFSPNNSFSVHLRHIEFTVIYSL
jgi:hypothetical protein